MRPTAAFADTHYSMPCAGWRGTEYHVSLVPKVLVITVVHDHEVPEVIETISAAARTGVMGDGKVFVSAVEQALRIRTGETGPQAI